MPLLAPTTLTTQGLRRRRAVAISSQQYLAHQKQKHSSHKPSSGALAHSQPKTGQQGGSSVKTCSPSPQQRAAPGLVLKSERRLQMRLDTEEEALEAMDILKDQQDADSSPLSSTPSSLDDAGLPELALGDVAVLKAQRRDGKWDSQLPIIAQLKTDRSIASKPTETTTLFYPRNGGCLCWTKRSRMQTGRRGLSSMMKMTGSFWRMRISACRHRPLQERSQK